MTFRLKTVLSALVMFAGAFASQADAAAITFEFTGRAVNVDSSLTGVFSENQIINGSYTFESTTAATFDPLNPSVASYYGLLAMELSIGSYSATYDSSGLFNGITVWDGAPGDYDTYSVSANINGPSIAGIPPDFFVFNLYDPSGTAFSTLALPLDASQFSSSIFPDRQFQLTFTEYIDPLNSIDHSVWGEITSIVAVPIPGALLLFVSGLFGPVAAFFARDAILKPKPRILRSDRSFH